MHKIEDNFLIFHIENLLFLYLYAIFLLGKDYRVFNLFYIFGVLFFIIHIIFSSNVNPKIFAIFSFKTIFLMQFIVFISTMLFWNPQPKLRDINIIWDYMSVFKSKFTMERILIYFFALLLLKFLIKKKIIRSSSHDIVFLHYLVVLYNFYQFEIGFSSLDLKWHIFVLDTFNWLFPISLVHFLYCTVICLKKSES